MQGSATTPIMRTNQCCHWQPLTTDETECDGECERERVHTDAAQ